jgi:hypothetical protein
MSSPSRFGNEADHPSKILTPAIGPKEGHIQIKGRIKGSFDMLTNIGSDKKKGRRVTTFALNGLLIKDKMDSPNLQSEMKEEIQVLDKLRSISRTAYPIEANINGITALRRQLAEARVCSQPFKSSKQITEYANKLIAKLDEKIKMIKDMSMTAYDIEMLSGRGKQESSTSLFTPASGAYKMKSGDETPGSPNMKLSKAGTPPSIGKSPQNSEKDLLRIALINASQRNGPLKLNKTLIDLNSGDGTDKEDSTPRSLMSPVNLMPSEESFGIYTKKGLSQSVCLPRRKPFDKTEKEETIEAIFKGYLRPKRNNKSMDPSAELRLEMGADDRLNTSCTLEYTSAYNYVKLAKHTRNPSAVAEKSVYKFDDETAKSKAYNISINILEFQSMTSSFLKDSAQVHMEKCGLLKKSVQETTLRLR